MNRNEFMIKLETLLADIPSEERKEALQYYRDYFEDAGAENEKDVIRELGSPEKLAAMIKADLKCDSSTDAGEFTEQGYRDERFEDKEMPARRDAENTSKETSSESTNAYGYTDKNHSRQTAPKTSIWLKVLLIALIVFIGAPIVIPIGIGIATLIIALVIAAFSFFAGLVIGAVAVMVAGAVVIIMGLTLIVAEISSAILTMGVGLLTFVIGLIGTVATVKLCMVMYPAMFRILVNMCRWPFHRRKAVAE